MSINIGLDIGAISLKLAALGKPEDRAVLEALCGAKPAFRADGLGGAGRAAAAAGAFGVPADRGQPDTEHLRLLQEFYEIVPEIRVEGIRVTGSGSRTIAKILGIYFENEFKAVAKMVGLFYPQVRTVFEIGGESSKYIRLEMQPDTGQSGFSITTGAESARRARVPSWISRRCGWATRWRRSAGWSRRRGARRGSRGGARCSRSRT